MAALKTQTQSEQWTKERGRFIPNPATWLRGRRWEDEAGAADPADTPEERERRYKAKIDAERERRLREADAR